MKTQVLGFNTTFRNVHSGLELNKQQVLLDVISFHPPTNNLPFRIWNRIQSDPYNLGLLNSDPYHASGCKKYAKNYEKIITLKSTRSTGISCFLVNK